MEEAPSDHELYGLSASSAADKSRTSAFTSHVYWMQKSACTHRQNGWDWDFNRLRKESSAFNPVVCSRSDGRDGESYCGAGQEEQATTGRVEATMEDGSSEEEEEPLGL
ncbi:hypothetical protein MMC22_011551 [Lobaria immixta]|nr:hypothetical protein [Lobaria immixta]